MNLRVPGPTPCPDEVLASASQQMINHRGPEFKDLIFRVTSNLQRAFETKNDVLILTASGTAALEAAIVNTLSPGDKVLAVVVGVFGERFAQIAEAYGAEVLRLTVPHGSAAEPDEVRQALKGNPAIKAVLITHNETSTGVTNDLRAIAQVVKEEFDKLLLVDAVSSIGALPLPVDEWRCDVVTTGSQKAWMSPPGIAMVSVSPQAWKAYETAKMPRFYLDFGKAKSYLERGQTPWTPAVSVLFGLDKALERLLSEGLPRIHENHAAVGDACRTGIKGLGLDLFPDERYASNTVTAIKVSPGVDAAALLERLRTRYNVILAGGQQDLSGKIIRVGHMGYVSIEDIDIVLDALQASLTDLGVVQAGV